MYVMGMFKYSMYIHCINITDPCAIVLCIKFVFITNCVLIACFRANTTVDQIASDIASSLVDTHVYSKVTSNGALPSLPIPMKRNPHLGLSLMNSGSFDGKLLN